MKRSLTTSQDIALGPRFMAYAGRVRQLDLEEDLVWTGAAPLLRRRLDDSVFQFWLLRPASVFPHLKSLELDNRFLARDYYSIAFLAAVAIPPNLSDLCLCIDSTLKSDPPAGFQDFLRTIAPGLRVLKVYARERPLPEAWTAHVNALLDCTTALVTLRTDAPIYFSWLLRTIHTRSLQYLSLGPIRNIPDTTVALELPSGGLNFLRVMDLEDDTPSAWLARDLVTLCGPTLEHCTLRLRGRSAYNFADVVALAKAIGRLPGIITLDLNMHDCVPGEPSTLEAAAILDALRPLSKLTELELHIPRMVVPSSYLTILLDACPHLCRVALESVPIAIPFVAFLTLLHHRPKVTELSVLLDITELPDAAMCAAFGTHPYIDILVFENVADGPFFAFRDMVTCLLPNVQRLATQDLCTRYWEKVDGKWRGDIW
jgi:hypothetical protein